MILAIDLNNLCHRVFHTPSGSLTKKDGTPSGVILGTMNSIKGLLEKFPDTTKVICCIDGGKSEWRKAMHPEYKAQRDYGKDDEEKRKAYEGLWNQMRELEIILPKMGVSISKVKGQEADDLLAGICKFSDEDITIVSTDKDLLQLISPKVNVYNPIKDKIIGEFNFEDTTGVHKSGYLSMRILIGDTSDNIPGIKGIGDKTAQKLIKTHRHIDNILNAQGDVKKSLMKSKVSARIFEPSNMNILARNNKIMSFTFTQYDEIKDEVMRSLEEELIFDSSWMRTMCMSWEYVSLLAKFNSWSMTFKMIGSESNNIMI